MPAKQIDISIILEHGATIKSCRFSGIGYLDAGFMSGALGGPDCELSKAERTLISAFTLTGCPVIARTVDPGSNPWRETGGSYTSSRALKSETFAVASTLVSQAHLDVITMELRLVVEGDLGSLIDIPLPFQEEISPSGLGCFSGIFDFHFLDENGKTIRASAESEYHLAVKDTYPRVWRNITISDFHKNQSMHQIEQIDLFSDSSEAAHDLAAKIGAVEGLTQGRIH